MRELAKIYDRLLVTVRTEVSQYEPCLNKSDACCHYIRQRYYREWLISDDPLFINISHWDNANKGVSEFIVPWERVSIRVTIQENLVAYLTDSEYRCRRPRFARYFSEHFGLDSQPQTCPVAKVVLKDAHNTQREIDFDRVYQIDYLLADKSSGIASRFGHSMLRLVICAPARIEYLGGQPIEIAATKFGPDCLKDEQFHLVVSFRALIEEARINFMKGLMGAYDSRLFMMSYPDVIEEYTRKELRNLVNYPLALDKTQKKTIIGNYFTRSLGVRGQI